MSNEIDDTCQLVWILTKVDDFLLSYGRQCEYEINRERERERNRKRKEAHKQGENWNGMPSISSGLIPSPWHCTQQRNSFLLENENDFYLGLYL